MINKEKISNSRILKDLIDYSKLPPKLVYERCKYAVYELAIQWKSKKNILDFYKNSELYLYDLTYYQMMLESHGLIHQMIKQIKRLKLQKILEYGGGIGEFSLLCNENNLNVTYYDLDGVIKRYALWRFRKHNAKKIVIAKKDPLNEEWDIVNIMDVLEHLKNSEKIINKLSKKAKYVFCNPNQIQFNVFYPQHISKYNIRKYFNHIESYLWKNKNL